MGVYLDRRLVWPGVIYTYWRNAAFYCEFVMAIILEVLNHRGEEDDCNTLIINPLFAVYLVLFRYSVTGILRNSNGKNN